jgi:hypothetical protein
MVDAKMQVVKVTFWLRRTCSRFVIRIACMNQSMDENFSNLLKKGLIGMKDFVGIERLQSGYSQVIISIIFF